MNDKSLPNWVLEGQKLREGAVAAEDGRWKDADDWFHDHQVGTHIYIEACKFIAAAPEYQERLEKALECAVGTLREIIEPNSEAFKSGEIKPETYALWCNLIANKALSEIERFGEK